MSECVCGGGGGRIAPASNSSVRAGMRLSGRALAWYARGLRFHPHHKKYKQQTVPPPQKQSCQLYSGKWGRLWSSQTSRSPGGLIRKH